MGQHRKTGPLEERFRACFTPGEPDECWIWQAGRNDNGYGKLVYKSRVVQATSLALMYAGRPLEPGGFACHTCDNPPCVNPAHLFAGDHRINGQDAARKGRTNYGEKHPNHKLTYQQVCEIRERYARGGCTHRGLAQEYGVSSRLIGGIVRRQRWTSEHLTRLGA